MAPRMLRLALPLLVIGAGCPAVGRAWPLPDERLCRRDEVIHIAGQHIRAQAHYAELDLDSVREWPTTDPNLVRCAIRFTMAGRPEVPGADLDFSVQVVGHRVMVRFAPWPRDARPATVR